MTEEALIKIRISTEGPRTRIAIDVPESVRAALRMTSLKQDRTQSELATEALVRFFTTPIGSYPSPPRSNRP